MTAFIAEPEDAPQRTPDGSMWQNPFADAESIAAYAKDAAAAMQEAGIISGKPGGMFDPKAGATRAEVSTMLHRFAVLFSATEDAVAD